MTRRAHFPSEVFAADLRGGAHDCFADAGQFAAAAAPPLLAGTIRRAATLKMQPSRRAPSC